MVAAQRQHRSNIDRAGLAFAAVDDPPKSEWMPLMAQFERLVVEAANARMVGELFAEIDTRAGAAAPARDRRGLATRHHRP
jgi:hypothetical protein